MFLIYDFEGLENGGKFCWKKCKGQQGKCDWCGQDGLCCRKNREGNECDGTFGGPDNHRCVLKPGTTTTTTTTRPGTYLSMNDILNNCFLISLAKTKTLCNRVNYFLTFPACF